MDLGEGCGGHLNVSKAGSVKGLCPCVVHFGLSVQFEAVSVLGKASVTRYKCPHAKSSRPFVLLVHATSAPGTPTTHRHHLPQMQCIHVGAYNVFGLNIISGHTVSWTQQAMDMKSWTQHWAVNTAHWTWRYEWGWGAVVMFLREDLIY